MPRSRSVKKKRELLGPPPGEVGGISGGSRGVTDTEKRLVAMGSAITGEDLFSNKEGFGYLNLRGTSYAFGMRVKSFFQMTQLKVTGRGGGTAEAKAVSVLIKKKWLVQLFH